MTVAVSAAVAVNLPLYQPTSKFLNATYMCILAIVTTMLDDMEWCGASYDHESIRSFKSERNLVVIYLYNQT